jgi:UDP-glucose 4-epimerase
VDDTPAPRTVYGETKLAGEEILRKIAASTPGMMLDILRPPMIVGPSAPGNLQILAAALRRGLPLPLASIRNRRMFLSIESLVAFLLTRLKSFEPGAHTFTLADADALSTPQVVNLLAESIGVRPRLVPFPPALLGLMLRLIRRPDKADALTKSLEVDIRAARTAGWAPTADIADALRQSFASSGSARRAPSGCGAALEEAGNAR